MKICFKCNESKDLLDFYKHKGMSDGHLNKCRVCTIKDSKLQYINEDKMKRKADNRLRAKNYTERKRAARLLGKYDLTQENYKTMLLKQGCACASCYTPAVELEYALYVDHDHTTGKVRGLLCQKCNSGIGMLGDDLFGVKSAYEYLSRAA